ncbi:MAG TPA: ATP-grasp domain-containing protein [Jatrophihabitans sp.]|nr:ATP-grasp domain-containing protein [Jatrophihabitans sp.]
MINYLDRSIVLVMRIGLTIRYDHIETMYQSGLRIHLLTEDPTAASDPRFASVRLLPKETTTETLVEEILLELKNTGSAYALTFLEIDIVAVGLANQRHGVAWARPDADRIARDKSLQRAHLRDSGLPTPLSLPVGDDSDVEAILDRIGPKFVVKPTRASSSAKVELVDRRERAQELFDEIRAIAHSNHSHFYDDGMPEAWALVEEFLPGDEITADGVVVDGRFYLGGVNTKQLPHPPGFEEDLYVLPYPDPVEEQAIAELMQALVDSLGVKMAIVNAELRRDSQGEFRFVEFSTRISGGHVYRHIRDVHAVDLVHIFLVAGFGDTDEAHALAGNRHPGRLATCIKFLYRTGVLEHNAPGLAARDPHFRRYYAIARPGQDVWAAPEGYDPVALLSVWGPYEKDRHPEAIIEIAQRMEGELDLQVRPFDS